ncbi:MAG: hypothetical protein E2O52_00570 [Gammaproteobacteria bacterium]|nr:MAG: hypothetical protein E2O52_00570 [Gammaproteobacteria bacterium]
MSIESSGRNPAHPTGSGDHGDEIGFSAKWPFAKYYSVLLKGAFYNASNHATDTTRIWIQRTANF